MKSSGRWFSTERYPGTVWTPADSGPRMEIVSRQLQPMMEHYFATGGVPS
jgi:hypothetical protein